MGNLDQMNRKRGCLPSQGIYHHAFGFSSSSEHNLAVQHAILKEIISKSGCNISEEVVNGD